MGGGDAAQAPSYPPPVDYSSAMMYQSDNNKTVAMGQIMAMQFAVQTASMDRQMQIAASLEQGLESLDTKLQIAKLNYIQSMTEEENRHEEKMTQIGADVDAARAAETAASSQEVTDFLANGSGGYSPGAAWDSTSSYANDNRVNFGDQWNQLLANDKEMNQNHAGMAEKHEEERTQQLNDHDNMTSPYGDADGDGIQNQHDSGFPPTNGST